MTTFQDINQFWFGDPPGSLRKEWFTKDEGFDALIRSRFLPTFEAALSGQLDSWVRTASSALALIVVLDQFPRNMFRGHARMFQADERALSVARESVTKGFDTQLLPIQRVFMYLPFEHSELLADQEQSVALFEKLPMSDSQFLDYARKHYDIIARFGRYPHRNQILGRRSTPEELEFLKTHPGF